MASNAGAVGGGEGGGAGDFGAGGSFDSRPRSTQLTTPQITLRVRSERLSRFSGVGLRQLFRLCRQSLATFVLSQLACSVR